MKGKIGVIINGNKIEDLLDGLTEIKLEKKSDVNRYVRSVCNAACWVAITAKDKNGTKWKFKIKRQTLEKIKTADDIFKYLNKLKNQKLRRIGRKIFAELWLCD